MTIIPLGRASPRASSHLPADSVGHVVVLLLGVAPRRDWPFHPDLTGCVTVPLILTSRWTGVTRYAALWSPDFPLCNVSGTATAWLASHRHFTLALAHRRGFALRRNRAGPARQREPEGGTVSLDALHPHLAIVGL